VAENDGVTEMHGIRRFLEIWDLTREMTEVLED
jgi:hypothetical protein